MPDGAKYFNRELTWVAFNRRVLEEAQGTENPLIERAKFLAIVTSNLDEFVMVRLAELRNRRKLSAKDPAGLTPPQQLERVREQVQLLVADQYRCWRDEVEPRLRDEGFCIVPLAEWGKQDRAAMGALYRSRIEPTCTPLAVDPTRPFPLLSGGGLHIGVLLDHPDGEQPLRALVTVPIKRRLFALPGEPGRYAIAEDVVEQFLGSLFPGRTIAMTGTFRLTRDGSLEIDEEDATNFLQEMEEEVRQRAFGPAVRLELQHDAPAPLREWLMQALELDAEDLVSIEGPLDLTFLFGVAGLLPRADLMDPPFTPRVPSEVWREDPFAAMRSGDTMVHHPFDSFQPIVELVERAAEDPDVLAIKQTLYRVSGRSPVVAALMRAARAGKQVTVLVELKARFDEEANIQWARRLEQAGAHVVYGLLGYKVHAKLLLIIRRDEDGLRRYCHLGTGNYNDKTANLYTDIGLLTTNEAVGRDVADLFNVLTGFAIPREWERLAVAPRSMRAQFNTWIQREAEHAKAGRSGRIIAKFNSLVDTGICDELYAASQAGVQVDLIVRGMCILRAGVPGLSENIRVISVVGRFLEHSRIYHFANAGEPVYAIASADWMGRNLDRRIESMVTITEPALQAQLADLLSLFLKDNCSARDMQSDGSYRRRVPAANEPRRKAQDQLLAQLQQAPADADEAERRAFTPLRKPRRRRRGG
ncbi:MAG: polyphosphate kinase 1 [Planctomycetota bacterium]|jgi:polyphosphate kinase|nr:polyphosphate kinase 1 [Planctomycetota bacterium]